MEIVIKISKSTYEEIKRYGLALSPRGEKELEKALKNGTPLPKHHGRLIDADALLDKKQDYGEGQMKLILIDPYYVRKAPTIIEADKEVE